MHSPNASMTLGRSTYRVPVQEVHAWSVDVYMLQLHVGHKLWF